jgi:putative effector of murein hydrolase LrgA (UPF0299 family)
MRILERLLLGLFVVTRVAFVCQGGAFALASIATVPFVDQDAADWLWDLLVAGASLSATFFIAGLLLSAARHWHGQTATTRVEPAWPWTVALGVSLAAVAGLAAIAAGPLPPLWAEIVQRLQAAGAWEDWVRPDASGLVLLPVLLALFVPALVTAAAVFSIAFPGALLVLLPARRPLFPTLLTMGTVSQAALVVSGALVAHFLGTFATEAIATMNASGDEEVIRIARDLEGAVRAIATTATALVAPLVVMAGWLVFLRPSSGAAAAFAGTTSPDA